MTILGTALSPVATKVMLLGSGELGKELAIELQRLGVEVIALDRYPNAPAQQIAHRSYTLSMLDEQALREIILKEKPDFIVPEIEAIATQTLLELEAEGFKVVPNARAANLTMNREGIRRLAAETLHLPTSPYVFVDNFEAFEQAVEHIGLPCLVKPIMSSSGRGQSMLKEAAHIEKAWQIAQEGARGHAHGVIVEGFVDFDYEITLLTVRHKAGTTFLAPIGHRQEQGDYQESWQPQQMSAKALENAQHIAGKITEALGGWGIFGVELFVKGDEVIFNEVSPRPHDTGLVTLISQPLSQFALHVRAFLGLPVPAEMPLYRPSASKAIVGEGVSKQISFAQLDQALSLPDTNLRLFGKGEINGHRRLGVCLAQDENIEQALQKVTEMSKALKIHY